MNEELTAALNEPLTAIESVLVGLTLLEGAITHEDPKAQLLVRVRDLIEEVQCIRDETE